MDELSAQRTYSTSTPPINLVVIQPTSFCNLDCTYCYVPERNVRRVIEFDVLEKLFLLLSESRRLKGQTTLDILWHAGEPLAAGLSFFKQASALLRSFFKPELSIRQSIQSNGTLLDEAWCAFFLREGIAVGLSLDGPRSIHDGCRRGRNGAGSFERAWAAAKMLSRFSIPTGALCVLTPKSIREPALMFDFFRSAGVRDVAFNVEETEGENRHSTLATAYSRTQLVELYGSFMEQFLAFNFRSGCPLRVREAQSMLQRIRHFRETGRPPFESERVLGAILTITRDGLLSSWSPELVSASRSVLSALTLGNVRELASIDDVLLDQKALAIQDEIDRGVHMCRQTCQYFSICGGGSPSNKFFENGSFASAETMHCAMQTKALAEVMLAGRFASLDA
jgi:uncharacterized protein